MLSREPVDISLLDIIKVLETEFFHTRCTLLCPGGHRAEVQSGKGCSREDICPTRILWSQIKTICESYLCAHTLMDLAQGSLEMEKANVEIF